MTEEQKLKMQEGRAKSIADKKIKEEEENEKKVQKEVEHEETKAKVDELTELVKRLQEELKAKNPEVVQIAVDEGKVYLRWQAECSPDNVLDLGAYGQITGQTGTTIVPKAEWSRFYTPYTRKLLEKRKLIVVKGFDEEEREMYNVDYKDGEILDQKAFRKLLDMGRDLIAIFPALCDSHKEMIAMRFREGYDVGHPSARDRDLILALNKLSQNDKNKKGLFHSIILLMNDKEATILES